MKPAADTVDLDDTGEVRLLEMPASVALEAGKPRLLPSAVGRWLAVLGRNVGKPGLRIVILRAKLRSHAQNRYLWGAVYVDMLEGMRARAVECGAEPPFASVEDLHAWARWKFLRVRRVFPGGEVEEIAGSTRCSLERFAEYISQLAAWGAERGIYVRQPNEERELV